ncbi:MAG TPA: PD-(D/E)XK nuclease family protein, partial [Candidatus Xenobia bacterium]
TKEPAVLARDLEALEQIEAVLSDVDDAARTLSMNHPVTLDYFHRLLMGGLETGSLPGHAAHRGGVRILNALDARGLAFDYLFMGGLAEGVWPQSPAPSPLFSDAEKARFRDGSGRRLFRSSRMAAWEDPLLFCLTLSMARRRATLSYPTTNGRGQATLPSYFFEEVRELVDTAVEETPLDQLVTPLEHAADPWELALGLLQRHTDDGVAPELSADTWAAQYPLLPGANARPLLPPLPHVWQAASIEQRRDRFFRTADPTRRAARANAWVGRLDPAVQALLRPGVLRWSASDLELFANCPTAWFFKKGLGLAEAVRPEVEAQPNVVGEVAHEIMHQFFRRQKEEGHWLFASEHKAQSALDAAAHDVFAKVEREPRHLGDRFFWQLKKKEVLAGLRGVVEEICDHWDREQQWTPLFFEQAFSEDVDVPGIGRIHVRGQIDRVDAGPAGYRVIDYKWSRTQDKLHEITHPETIGDTKFQLALYLQVCQTLLPRLTPHVAEGSAGHGAIHLLRRPELRGRAFDPPEPGWLSEVLGRAVAGQFDTSPKDCPLSCAYRNVCRFYLPHEEPL